MSPWVLFESTDALTAHLARRSAPPSAAAVEVLELLGAFARRIAPDVLVRGELVQVDVRIALFGAAVEQLGVLARDAGVGLQLPDDVPGGRDASLGALDREHRLFDAARVRLWLAEDGDPSGLDAAAAVFEELGAHPYAERATRLRRSATA